VTGDADVNFKRTWGSTATVKRLGTVAIVAVFVALLAGCASQVVTPPEPGKGEPAEFPGACYRALLAQGKPVFRVDPAGSTVVIEVRRGGSLARLGHDHVVASHDLAGFVAPDEERADLWVPLDTLTVDEPALRAKAGFETEPSAQDIAGTRSNMMARVLKTDQHPHALIAVSALGSTGNSIRLRIAITLHGTTRSFETGAEFDRTEDELSVSGAIAIDQSEFGIVPLSVLGGAIAVQDRLNMSYRIRARRME
jgi:YceI-like domain